MKKSEDLKVDRFEVRKIVLEIRLTADGVVFTVRVQPRASKDEVAGEIDGAMKVRLRAPALEDRANDALCEYLARLLKTPKWAVRILSGDRSRVKRIAIRGVTEPEVRGLLTQKA
jgi:uncharacterized protein (TIGR00251 family)